MRGLIQLILFVLMITLLVSVILGQPRPSNRNRNRGRNRSRNRPRNRNKDDPGVWCYTCFADFENIPFSVFKPVDYITNNLCYYPGRNSSQADIEFLTKCSPTTRYCQVDITRLNGVLLSVDRRCGASTFCHNVCISRSFAPVRETCTFCCGGRINEEHPNYDEELHSVYKCPTVPH